MALKFEKIEPVEFGDLKVMPKMNAEMKLRVQAIKQIDSDALDLFAECFEGYHAEIREFLDQLNMIDLYKLQAYLIGGNASVKAFEARLESIMAKGEVDG